jgi:SAM-dependent methyltransferase
VRGVPSDYYARLHEVEASHWWLVGMRRIAAGLLEGRTGGALLDAGCGTGGFLAWAAATGSFDRLCGIDVSPEAIEWVRSSLPRVEALVGSVVTPPFDDEEFDLVVLNDVLQHVPEDAVSRVLMELRRMLRPGGALLVRTNGARRLRLVRPDWRAYDAATLGAVVRSGGFRVERLTYANCLLSLMAAAPQPPTETSCGIPQPAGRVKNAIGGALLGLEARYLRRPGRTIPYGHTLLALGVAV